MRRSAEDIGARRRARETVFLVTGGTGFIGSHIAVALLERGHAVMLLCRGARGLSSRHRVERVLDWFGLVEAAQTRLEVIDGSLERPDFGLARGEYDALAKKADEIIHCAASTSFSERKRPEVEAANIDGARNILDLAARGACSFFHLVSTAYVAGNRAGECAEEFVETTRFLNVYEETKHRAEGLARDACRAAGIRLSIYRPPIIHGDSRTGRSIQFNALYYPVKSLVFLRDLYERDIRENGGRKAMAMGITRGTNGDLHLPMRIETSGDGSLDLVPIDHFVRAFLAIMEDSLDGDIFHIVSRKPKRLEELVEYTQRFFAISGVRVARPEEFDRAPMSGLESLFGEYIEAYMPYMNDSRIFRSEKAEKILGKRALSCPEFDYQSFSRCMSYAVSVGWGKKLFSIPN